MRPICRKSLCLLLLLLPLATLPGAVYYVSSERGNDTSSGRSATSPWQTLSHACSRINSNDTLMVFRGSVFRESDVSINDGTLEAYGPEKYPLPVLAGSKAYRKWQSVDQNSKIFVTPCADDVQHVYCNGQLLRLARFPNSGWLRADSDNNGKLINASVLQQHPRNKAGYWNGANVRWRRWSWWFETRTVSNWDGSKALHLAGEPIGPDHSGDGSGFYLDNKFEELDHPGEWFLDKDKKLLYVYPPEDIDGMNTALIEGSVFDKGVNLGNATIRNLEIRHFKDQAVSIGQAGTLDGCILRSNCSTAIRGNWNANGAVIKNCRFENNLNVGISWNENKSEKSKTIIHDNIFNNTGMVAGYGGSGVWHAAAMIIYNADGVHVHHNRINGTGYCGIILGSPNQIIEYNVFRKCMSTLNDGAAIYTNCDATIIRHNIILDTVGENQISSHKWANLGQGIWPEFLDDFKDTKIINNTVVNSGCHGIFLGNNYTCEITGNVLFGNKNGMFLNGRAGKPPQNHQITNNVFVSMNTDQTPILFRTGYNYGSMSGNMFANPYGNWVASNGDNWGRGHMTADEWVKQYSWSDKNPKLFVGTVAAGSSSAIGRPHCFINDTRKAVSIPLSDTWYTIDKQKHEDAVSLEPFSSIVLILAKGRPGKLVGDYTLASEQNSPEADLATGDDAIAQKKKQKNKISARAKADKPTISNEQLKAWQERLVAELQRQLKDGINPYFDFMGKEYRVDGLNGKLIKISAGPQKMSYPIDRLKIKDRCSLSIGLTENGRDEARAIAAIFLFVSGQSVEAETMKRTLTTALRQELEDAGL